MKTSYATQNEMLWQFDSALEVERACEAYLDTCTKKRQPPTVFGLCLELGTNPHTLRKWLAEDPTNWHTEIKDEGKRRRCAEAVGKTMITIGKYAEEHLYDNATVKGSIKVLSDLFDILPKKQPQDPLRIVLPPELEGLAK